MLLSWILEMLNSVIFSKYLPVTNLFLKKTEFCLKKANLNLSDYILLYLSLLKANPFASSVGKGEHFK